MKDLVKAVEKHRQLMFDAHDFIWAHPETGYREVQTTNYLKEQFEKLGYDLVLADGITGFYTVLDTGKPGPEIMILGELDSLIVPNHPECDKKTGYVHACGHHAQCATLLGIAAALKEPNILDKFCGRIRLVAVPAEEMIEFEYRNDLIKQGKIKYLGGKGEFMWRGYFDGVDLAFMVHTSSSFGVKGGSVGCLAKTIKYKGVSSHAGGSPWNGKNAMYAAIQGLSSVNAIRETFKESDIIRFHPIITEGGQVVNAIPESTTIETFVRGKTYDAILAANKRINQALCGAALSLGTNVEIIDCPGYSPLVNNADLMQLTKQAADLIIPEENFFISYETGSGSTDMAELCHVMPAIHPYTSGTVGKSHGHDYYIQDKEKALVKSAKLQLAMLLLLLENNGERAKQIIANYTPTFKTKQEYFDFMDSLNQSGDRIVYDGDTATVKIN